MAKSFSDDPYTLLATADDLTWPKSADPLNDAIAAFDEYSSQPLVDLLRSDDPLVVKRGLYVFGELGRKGVVVLDSAVLSAAHPDRLARSSLMDGVLSCSRDMNPNQVSLLLPLVDDDGDLVRTKMIAFLGAVQIEVLRAATKLLDCPDERRRHAEGLNKLKLSANSIQSVFDDALIDEPFFSTYRLASIERAARNGNTTVAPRYDGEDYVGACVAANTLRLVNRRRRAQAKKGQAH